jgi:glutathione S-transferase
VRKGLGCPAVRQLDDGSDFFTLPVLRDPASGAVVGDSFDIAVHLDDAYPSSGDRLFPPDSTGAGLGYESPNKEMAFAVPLTAIRGSKHEAYARFNVQVRHPIRLNQTGFCARRKACFSASLRAGFETCKILLLLQVDAMFTAHVLLVAEHMPFNPGSAEAVRATFVKRAHLGSWDDLCVRGQAREQLRAAFKAALASLAGLYAVHDAGPYLEGQRATYADLIVGGWLNMLACTMPAEEWKDFRTWHGGVFARLHDALQANYWECK